MSVTELSPSSISPLSIEALQHLPLFDGLVANDLDTLVRLAQPQQLCAGERFFRQGEPATALYVLVQGRVRLSQVTLAGQQVIVRFAGPGEMFGGVAALGVSEYPASAEALETCQALAWDGETMAQLIERFPRLARNVLQRMAARIQELQDRLREMATERVERRVARTLLRLIRQTGRKVEGGILLDLPLTRQDLAEMAGTTLYTVSRILSRWEKEGITGSAQQRVIVRVPHALVVIAEDLPSPSSDAADSG